MERVGELGELAIQDSAERRAGEGGSVDLDDAELVRAAKVDPEAFGALHERYRSGVYQYLRTRTETDEDAADLTQQVIAQAWAALPAYRDEGLPIAAWLFRIARNLVVDYYRRRRDTVAWESVPVALQPADAGDMESDVLRREAVDRLRGLLARVDPEKRDLLALRFSGGMKTSEIAHVLGRSEGAIKMDLHRTLLALKEAYDED